MLATQSFGKALYLRLRPDEADEEHTLKRMALVLQANRDRLPEHAPVGSYELLREYAHDGRWEQVYTARSPSAAMQRKENRLLKELTEAERDLEIAQNVLQSASDAFTVYDEEGRGEEAYKNYARAQVIHATALGRYQQAEDALNRHLYEATTTAQHKARVADIFGRLLEEYGELGPQYAILARRLAEITAKIEAMNESGRIAPEEEARLYNLVTSITNQLQKHTEATRSESVSKEAQEMVRAVLKIVEGVVATENPQLWSRALQTVRAKVVSA